MHNVAKAIRLEHDGGAMTAGAPSDSALTARLAGISKSFAGVAALTDVSVEFRAGEVHAILGENGAGKSTLMNIIAGVLGPDTGEIEIAGRRVLPLTPESAAAAGVAISYQHPAILDDLSVIENLKVALPPAVFASRPARDAARDILGSVGLTVPLAARCDTLTVAQKQLLEIGKALAVRPKLLILDEPTASLDQDATDLLFARIRGIVKEGTAVIYITHRLAELRQIAQRVTVLRDGKVRGGGLVAEVTDEDLLRLIVGRTLGSTFPPKAGSAGDEIFSANDLTGPGFRDVSLSVARGEIVGIAGVAGNGQTGLIRTLAGLHPFQGELRLGGRGLSHRELQRQVAFMPSDRHAEGLAGDLTIRENAALGALDRFASGGIVNRRRERESVSSAFASLAVKAPSVEAAVSSLSGGNQQKVVMARALLSEPGLIVADEPTQGVDVGARAEIYKILREVTASGTPVIVNSSDAVELEGLCDRVLVMSRGRVVETLTGEDVREDRIVAAAVQAATHAGTSGETAAANRQGRWRHFVQLDNAAALPLLAVTVLLALFGYSQNPNFLSAFNISNILLLATALGFVALGQTIPLLLGAIDLSVGPLMGFLVIIASFFVLDDMSAGTIAAGFVLMVGAAVAVGLVNGLLIRFANFTAIAATLAMFIGLQGLSFLFREAPGGYITYSVVEVVTWQIGPVPVAFLILVALALAAEWALRATPAGWRLRALGSNEESARRTGLHIDRIFIGGYIVTALFAVLGGVMLMAQIGVGDPQQGANYTLASITAVVLGGTSLKGGRGTFIGSILGALLLTEVLSIVTFLGLSQMFQYIFQGTLILIAALIYSAARGRAATGQ
ncbi:MAG: ATP-binding cassette domain-containing protein [Paracoccaceae bacterium]